MFNFVKHPITDLKDGDTIVFMFQRRRYKAKVCSVAVLDADDKPSTTGVAVNSRTVCCDRDPWARRPPEQWICGHPTVREVCVVATAEALKSQPDAAKFGCRYMGRFVEEAASVAVA